MARDRPCAKQRDCTAPLACATDYRCRNLCDTDDDCNVLGVTGRVCARDDNDIKFCADPGEETDGRITSAPPPGADTSQGVSAPSGVPPKPDGGNPGVGGADPEGGVAGFDTGGVGGSGGAGGSATVGTSGSATVGIGGNTTGGVGGIGGGGTGGSGAVCTKQAGASITDFGDLTPHPVDVGQFTFATPGLTGGTFSYPNAITLDVASEAVNVKGNVANWSGFGVYLNSCSDASAYDGVSFSIKGNAGPRGKLSFRVQTRATTPWSLNPLGSCKPTVTADPYPECHASSLDIHVAAGVATVQVNFSDLQGGAPVSVVDGKDVLGFEWAFAWESEITGTPYDTDITIDDLTFTNGVGPVGTGGAPSGAGAASGPTFPQGGSNSGMGAGGSQ